MVEHPLCDREVAGLIPGRFIPKTLKLVLAALSLGAQHSESRTGQPSVSIMWLGGISCQSVWGMIVQWGSTLKVSIELPATSRHGRDMTERLLKATLSPNQTNNFETLYHTCPKFLWSPFYYLLIGLFLPPTWVNPTDLRCLRKDGINVSLLILNSLYVYYF